MATVSAGLALTVVVVLAACKSTTDGTKPPPVTGTACGAGGTVQLAVAQAARLDCSNGGTLVTLAGNGASYLIVAEFAVDHVANQFVSYSLTSGATAAATVARESPGAASADLSRSIGLLPAARPMQLQQAFDHTLRAEARRKLASGAWRPSTPRARATLALRTVPPPAGSIRSFHVRSSLSPTNATWATVGARLAYPGTNVLVYIDTLAPAGGFTPSQLQTFGQLFDQVLYPIDTAAFGQPSDIDQNGEFIMLMSPVVNADTPKSTCLTQGYVAGFFDELDLGDVTNANSNKGEIFYTVVPDTGGTVSCAHTVAQMGESVPSTFLHELQHLISFSQHVIVHGGNPEDGWLDEGLSLVAQELGSVHYEQMCPPPSCRTSPAQLFPDSSQGYIADELFDMYKFAQRPETASTTLHSDSDNGFSWRGGDWLLMRWLGDQFGAALYKKLDQSTSTGVANIESASGQAFPGLFADFGLALYTDSLPGQPRATAPSRDRFLSRNPRALWARLFATRGTGDTNFPLAFPLPIQTIPATATTASLAPGTMSYYRLDTQSTIATITLKFAAPGDAALLATLHPQLSIFRLPPGICTECDVVPR
jgi:hypothetical protein